LQAGFRRYRNSTPIEFVRVQRLAKAREALAGAQPGTRVTDVALGVGYFHLGRFAAEYKARYGESPSDTLARSRRPPA
ncbi:MAG: helix-turn-helix domain-containing protein, partial [Burkholderiaceae bacterium]|nr:helix-turn-helix domain-containing protein [Burkholderiaceae bacterium]